MSRPEPPDPPVETTRSLKRKKLSQDDQDDLDDLDAVFKRIRTAVPRNPYLLSTPSLDPYRYHSQQEANAWMIGHLWRPDEEHLQYRTFVFREPCQDCLELQAGEDDEPEPDPGPGPSNTGGQVAKKKLNLSAFKVKQVNGTATPNSKKTEPNKAHAQTASTQVNGVKKPENQPASQRTDHRSPKRSSAESQDERKATKSSREQHGSSTHDHQRSPSHRKDSAESKMTIDKSNPSNSTPHGGTPHGLPPLLSPVHEPPSNPYGLPDILSPTLPSNIQAELDRLETTRKRAESNASTSTSMSSSDRKTQSLAVPNAQNQKQDEATKPESRARTVSVSGKSPHVEAPKRTEERSPKLVVKLKFSKAKIPTVSQILRLPPKRKSIEKKEQEAPPQSQAKESPDESEKKKKPVPKIVARRPDGSTPVSTPSAKPATTSNTPAKAPEKRRRPDEDVPLAVPSKRPKVTASQDRPLTPTHQVDIPNRPGAQKTQAQYTTPKHNPKTSTMLRTASAESHDSTSGRSVATPAGAKQDSKPGPTSSPLNSKKQADIALLAQTSMKLNQMGRALKHEATKILTSGGKITKQDEKRAAVTNMECILSYMAAYYAQDFSLILRGRPAEVEQTWKTLLPLCLSYARSTRDFKHLDGLRSYLSSIIASAICTHVSQRVATSRPHDSPQDVPHADLARQHAALVSNFALLSDHTVKMNQHYQDARIALPIEDIQSQYKKTFAARETNARLAKEAERINGARMSGPYFLPLSNDTTPIQAVRFGLKFLAEYCEREKLEYGIRVNLDKPK